MSIITKNITSLFVDETICKHTYFSNFDEINGEQNELSGYTSEYFKNGLPAALPQIEDYSKEEPSRVDLWVSQPGIEIEKHTEVRRSIRYKFPFDQIPKGWRHSTYRATVRLTQIAAVAMAIYAGYLS